MKSIIEKFKPNLIPNNPKNEVVDHQRLIMRNGGYREYCVLLKQDGCRLELANGEVLSRELKIPGSRLVVERFKPISEMFKRLNILAEGEFYMHGLKFNSIFRFFSKSDVTCPSYKLQLQRELDKNPKKFFQQYETTDIDFLTTFHDDLKLHIFDCIILDRPDLVGYKERMEELELRLSHTATPDLKYIEVKKRYLTTSSLDVRDFYNQVLENGYEGLVLVHKNHSYKFGRNTLNQGTLLKMKDDALEYDGIVLDILEATSVKEGVERGVSRLGYSETSKKKEDRELSGLAKGFLVEFEGKGTFPVGLKGFDNEDKAELLKNKKKYIGRHFVYTGMLPVKNFPRHAYFKHWRDAKI